MRNSRVRLLHFCGPFLAAVLFVFLGVGVTQADLVDDLLAGKPVNIPADSDQDAPRADTSAKQLASNRAIVSEETTGSTSLAVNLAAPEIAGESDDRVIADPPAPISLVPEPSAIALASLALVYFFIFFRRRYA